MRPRSAIRICATTSLLNCLRHFSGAQPFKQQTDSRIDKDCIDTTTTECQSEYYTKTPRDLYLTETTATHTPPSTGARRKPPPSSKTTQARAHPRNPDNPTTPRAPIIRHRTRLRTPTPPPTERDPASGPQHPTERASTRRRCSRSSSRRTKTHRPHCSRRRCRSSSP